MRVVLKEQKGGVKRVLLCDTQKAKAGVEFLGRGQLALAGLVQSSVMSMTVRLFT